MTVSDEAPSSQDLGDLLTRLDPELLPGRLAYVDLEQSSARSVADQSILSCAVGLTAAVRMTLFADGIPCNVIARKNHDHLLVLFERSDGALGTLKNHD